MTMDQATGRANLGLRVGDLHGGPIQAPHDHPSHTAAAAPNPVFQHTGHIWTEAGTPWSNLAQGRTIERPISLLPPSPFSPHWLSLGFGGWVVVGCHIAQTHSTNGNTLEPKQPKPTHFRSSPRQVAPCRWARFIGGARCPESHNSREARSSANAKDLHEASRQAACRADMHQSNQASMLSAGSPASPGSGLNFFFFLSITAPGR